MSFTVFWAFLRAFRQLSDIEMSLLSTPSRSAWTCNAVCGDSNAHMRCRAPYNSGFARKSHAKHLEFQAGLYCNEMSYPFNRERRRRQGRTCTHPLENGGEDEAEPASIPWKREAKTRQNLHPSPGKPRRRQGRKRTKMPFSGPGTAWFVTYYL